MRLVLGEAYDIYMYDVRACIEGREPLAVVRGAFMQMALLSLLT